MNFLSFVTERAVKWGRQIVQTMKNSILVDLHACWWSKRGGTYFRENTVHLIIKHCTLGSIRLLGKCYILDFHDLSFSWIFFIMELGRNSLCNFCMVQLPIDSNDKTCQVNYSIVGGHTTTGRNFQWEIVARLFAGGALCKCCAFCFLLPLLFTFIQPSTATTALVILSANLFWILLNL